jgi:hypothetical protein
MLTSGSGFVNVARRVALMRKETTPAPNINRQVPQSFDSNIHTCSTSRCTTLKDQVNEDLFAFFGARSA